jgi:hypothetical protein
LVIANQPFQEILERTRERSGVFRCREQDRVRAVNGGTQTCDGRGERIAIVIRVEERKVAYTVVQLIGHTLWRHGPYRAQDR